MPELTIWMELKREFGKEAYKYMKFRYVSDYGKGKWEIPTCNKEVDIYLDPPEIEWKTSWTHN